MRVRDEARYAAEGDARSQTGRWKAPPPPHRPERKTRPARQPLAGPPANPTTQTCPGPAKPGLFVWNHSDLGY